MQYRQLGNTDLQVSILGIGCASLAGDLYQSNGNEAVFMLQEAFDAGINFFDTADMYQFGESERLIGRALKNHRHKVCIATKGGEVFSRKGYLAMRAKPLLKPVAGLLKPWRNQLVNLRDSQKQADHSASHFCKALEASLKRLQTDYIDLYQVHIPNAAMLESGEFAHTMEAFRQAGKIRYYGVSCGSVEEAELCLKLPGVATVQVVVSLLNQDYIDPILPACQKQGKGVIARAPLAKTILTDHPNPIRIEKHLKDPEKRQRYLANARRFHYLINDQRTFAQAAINFARQQTAVGVVIPGISTREHLAENLGALRAPLLTPEEMAIARNGFSENILQAAS